ncbi:methionyl-tRNA formyltransferase [Candidatus Scalindua japonica]|uniref:Methionyl-tRNA formyltransferase n=1 Tax=Candidatus Scalindua japonica TaxID=1284222 RepID=A0A286TWP8_9BACT|nr:formyltransferase [Candidatus Scalindua japonica]GAX60261.1 methionyl-tRNA formyltransferase [Candidatus Scalindua japonica]
MRRKSVIKIIVLGYHNIGCRCLEYLLGKNENVVAVFTHKDNPEENLFFDSMAEIASSAGILCYTPGNINYPEWVAFIKELAPDIIFSFYYRNMISREILSIPRLGAINLHGSLLPKYRGRCPVNWVLVNGEKETGVTLHYMVDKPDAGGIIAQEKIPILFTDTSYTLHKKMEKKAVVVLDRAWGLIKEERNERIPQDLSIGSYFGGRTPDDGKIDWNRGNLEIYNLVRAVTHPWPGAFCIFRNQKMIIWECEPVSMKGYSEPGSLVSFDRKGIIVAARDGALLLKRCQIKENEKLGGYKFAIRYSLHNRDIFT